MRLVDLDTALFPAKSDPTEDNDTVARVAPLVRDKSPLPELLINLLHPSMQSLSPRKRLGLEAADDLEVRVQLIRRKIPVASVPAFEPGLDQFDVLPRHRLLRQPGGFEGLVRVSVAAVAGDLAASNGDHPCHRGVALDPAPPASDSAAAKDDDVAADRFDVIGVGAKFVPDVGYLSEVGTYSGVAVVAAALPRGSRSGGGIGHRGHRTRATPPRRPALSRQSSSARSRRSPATSPHSTARLPGWCPPSRGAQSGSALPMDE